MIVDRCPAWPATHEHRIVGEMGGIRIVACDHQPSTPVMVLGGRVVGSLEPAPPLPSLG